MREIDVRKALYHSEIAPIKQDDPSTLVVDELVLPEGDCRIDVAAINGKMYGYELKSASDTLERLAVQQVAYSQVFDQMTLVLSESHLKKAEELIPEWWGVILVLPTLDGFCLYQLKQAMQNPTVNPFAIAQLLWKDEAVGILLKRGFPRSLRSKTKLVLWKVLAENIELDALKDEVRQALKQRPDWRAQHPQTLSGG